MRDKNRIIRVVLQKMIKYCDNVNEIMAKYNHSYDCYVSEITFQYSCNMCILQIGELTTRLPEDFKEQYHEVPWRKIKALRNIHVHEYDDVDFDIMWEILQNDIPALHKSLEKILTMVQSEKRREQAVAKVAENCDSGDGERDG